MNTKCQDQNNELINLINILPFVVWLENMQENRMLERLIELMEKEAN